MKNMRRYLFMLIGAFCIIGLSACGGGGDGLDLFDLDDDAYYDDPIAPNPDDPAADPPAVDAAIKLYNAGESPWVSDIIEDSAGNILAVATDDNETNVTVVKVDSTGTQIWNRYSESGTSWVETANIFEKNSGYIVTGSIDATGGSLFLLHADTDGNWSPAWLYDCPNRGSIGRDSVRLDDGSIIFAGFTDRKDGCSTIIDYGNALLTGIGAGGSQDFRTDYNYLAGNSDEFMAIVAVSGGGYAVAGSTNEYDDGSGYGGPKDTILVRTDSIGNVSWTKNYGYQSDDGGNQGAIDLIKTSDGGFAILARSGYAYGMYVIKTDASGNVSWHKNAVSNDPSYIARKFVQAADGGFIIVGQGKDSQGAVVKLNSSGTKLWEYNMDDIATAITTSAGGGYLVAGHVTVDFGVDKIFILKLDDNGNRIW